MSAPRNSITNVSSGNEAGSVLLSPGHRFQALSTLRLWCLPTTPLSLRQISSRPGSSSAGNSRRSTSSDYRSRKVSTEGMPDLARIPYAAETTAEWTAARSVFFGFIYRSPLNKAPHVRLILISTKTHRAQALKPTKKQLRSEAINENSARCNRTGQLYSLCGINPRDSTRPQWVIISLDREPASGPRCMRRDLPNDS